MLDKLLVPLDGSPLADRILSLLRRLLAQREAQVELVQVLAPRDIEREKAPGQLTEEARKHLDADAALLRAAGTRVETRVLVGDPAERLLLHATETAPALIVMSTHGRSGVQRWVRGSVAERVLRNAKAPLLLANPFVLEGKGEIELRRILVPLDGSDEAASILPLVGDLARLYKATIVLHFTTPVSTVVNGVAADYVTADDARRLLQTFVPRLGGLPVELSTANGDPASTILDAAAGKSCDLVAMTTTGRSSLAHWILGSVAENVVRHARCPLLVKRV